MAPACLLAPHDIEDLRVGNGPLRSALTIELAGNVVPVPARQAEATLLVGVRLAIVLKEREIAVGTGTDPHLLAPESRSRALTMYPGIRLYSNSQPPSTTQLWPVLARLTALR
jgi:hypothetical protein